MFTPLKFKNLVINRIDRFPIILLLCIYFIGLNSGAQTNFSGQILSKETNFSIAFATISDIDLKKNTTSNFDGRFTVLSNGTIIVMADGYKTREIELKKNNGNLIYLEPAQTQLDEVLITTTNIPGLAMRSSQTISQLTQADLKVQNNHDLSAHLNTISGVFMQSGTLNTNRITIRGIGARNLFGTANIRAYFGDIPLTDGNGESAIEDLEIQALSSITIYKGPSSSSFGVGLGGTIILNPQFAKQNEDSFEANYTYGSFGFQKSLFNTKLNLTNTNINIIYSNTHSDGYRDNNQYDRNTITIASQTRINDNDEITVLGSFIDLKGGIPSSLTKMDFESEPTKAAFTWGRSMAFEDVLYGIIGASWRHSFNTNLSLLTSINASINENFEPRPFNILSEDAKTIGMRSRVVGNSKLGELRFDFSLGGELFLDYYNNSTFENLYEDFNDNRGSVKGDQLTKFKERRNYFNLFAETKFYPTTNLAINAGLHLNRTNFRIKDRLNSAELNNNGEFNFDYILSPKIGYNLRISDNWVNYGNVSHGFSTPTTSETLMPDGVFNPNLKPEIGWNFETGFRFNSGDKKLNGNLAIYAMQISDLLVSRRTVEDDFFAINAGKANHKGLEADVSYNLFKNKNSELQINVNATLNDFRFKEFIDDDNDFSGNRITGVPKYTYNLAFQLNSYSGFYGRVGFQAVGKMAANDDNSVFSEAYELLNAKIGYRRQIAAKLKFDFSLSANNLLNVDYASQLQINARAFGTNAPRYFYPGLPFNGYASLALNYSLVN